MITYQDIVDACKDISTTNIKGKEYAQVNQRVIAFRKLFPDGFVTSRMVSNEDGVCVFDAEVGYYTESGERVVLASGSAYEREQSSYINKTSYIENCQTSAVGRALGFAGFGIDTSIASSEEMVNALDQQAKQSMIEEREAVLLEKLCKAYDININALMKQYKVKELTDLTSEQYAEINRKIEEHVKLKAQS